MTRPPIKHSIFVGPDGLLKFIYDDDLLPLLQLGHASVVRASHVEPTSHPVFASPEGPGWTADMTPSGGPMLGPFSRRSDALRAEVNWLDNQFQSNGVNPE